VGVNMGRGRSPLGQLQVCGVRMGVGAGVVFKVTGFGCSLILNMWVVCGMLRWGAGSSLERVGAAGVKLVR